VEYVTENDFYMNKDSIDDFVSYLLTEKLKIGRSNFGKSEDRY